MADKNLYLGGAVAKEGYPHTQLPEIAMLGRSNVGKSSLINRLANRKNLAHISGTPGKTRLINFYKIENRFVLVDLPGYGYAKVSKQERERWRTMIDSYLHERLNLCGLIQLVDMRHLPSELDLQMYRWVKQRSLPFIIVATKSDKVKRSQRAKHKKDIRLKLDATLDPAQPICFSAVTGEGRGDIWSFLNAIVTEV